MTKAMIELENINIAFKQKKKVIDAVKDVTIRINTGDIYGIVGYSGAGKSTLVRTINLLQQPTTGRITVDGDVIFDDDQAISNQELRVKRRDIGMIFQHFNLMSQMTAWQNVAFALKHSDLPVAEQDKKVDELLELVGLSDRADNYPAQLSGGQKQRVAIARALANDPKILISDEATSALDPKTTKQILELLQEINRRLGVTIVLITHEMQIVKDIANRVAVMQDGKLLEEGSVLEIFSNPQEDLTKEFIEVATGLGEALSKIEDQPLVKNLAPGDLLVQLKYAGASTDEPVLNSIYRDYGVSTNILYGNLEILEETPVGEMVAILSGQEDQLTQAHEALVAAGVSVSVLKKGE